MDFGTRAVCAAAALLCSLGFSGSASADAVYTCSNCSQAQEQATALAGPLGWTYVIDEPNAQLTLWNVRKDLEIRRKVADEFGVDPQTYKRYLFTLDSKIQAQATGQSLIVVNVSPDAANDMLFGSNPFNAYQNATAYDFVQSVTMRSQLGTSIAEAMALGNNPALKQLGMTLNSVAMSMSLPVGFKIIIKWRDGSTTVFTVTSSTTHEAQYAPGESRDANGNPIPDSSVNTGNGPNYAGEYHFSSGGQMAHWVNAGSNYGVILSGTPTGSNSMRCYWDPNKTTLQCYYQ